MADKNNNERITPKKEEPIPRSSENEDVISNAMDFWKLIYENKKVQIRFIKQNGEVRYMLATLDFNLIPVEKRPKKVDMVNILKLVREKGLIRVFDLEKKDWRSVPFMKVTWVKTQNNRTYRVLVSKKG